MRKRNSPLLRDGTKPHPWGERLLDRFVVGSSSGEVLPFLDSLRAVAVLMVLAVHTWTTAGRPTYVLAIPATGARVDLAAFIAMGSVGVQLFFVLSGFLLAQQWMRAEYLGEPRPSLRKYFRRRLLRILPGYYCALFIAVALFTPLFIDPHTVYTDHGAVVFGLHLLMLHNLLPVTIGQYSGAWWTLTVEMMFYLVLPWAALAFVRRRWVAGITGASLITVAWFYFPAHALGPLMRGIGGIYQMIFPPAQYPGAITEALVRSVFQYQIPGYCVPFGIGMLLANCYVRNQLGLDSGRVYRLLSGHRAGKIYFVAGWVIVAGTMAKLGQLFLAHAPLYLPLMAIPISIGFALVIAGLLLGGAALQAWFSAKPVRLFGIVSYSAYLWHGFALMLIKRLSLVAGLRPGARFLAMYVLALIATIILAVCFYLMVERPFLVRARGTRGSGYRENAGHVAERRPASLAVTADGSD